MPWVKNVKVDFERKQATMSAETAQFDENALVAVLKAEGFDGKLLK